jgi:methylenetetrahydrofolate reductase (NADPH)
MKSSNLLNGYSIEMVPHTAKRVENFAAILPAGTRVYLAYIEGTPITDMVATAARINEAGFDVMPHFPARLIADKSMLQDWIVRYQGEANVRQALLIAGGVEQARGAFSDTMQLLETGLFDEAGFQHLHVAGHPEGSLDIDPDGGDKNVMKALQWKQSFSNRTDAKMGITTQFIFDANPVVKWAEALQAAGISLPIHLGIAGPTQLRMLAKYAVACGVGSSLQVLRKRKFDLRKLFRPYTPIDVIAGISAYKRTAPNCAISSVHFFPFGGIEATTHWAKTYNMNHESD